MERNAYGTWAERGSLTMEQKVSKKVAKILADHKKPSLPVSTANILAEMVKTPL
jgi:trimethylamine:corrinoid methyltransferase-like protein